MPLQMLQVRLFLVLIVLSIQASAPAQGIPPKPAPPRLVNDLANILSADEVRALETKLVSLDNATSIQIAVITLTSLNGYDKNEMARMIGESWGVGQAGKDNGIVILVKPKYQNERGEVAIQVGYGLEGIIPDAMAKKIISQQMVPQFRLGNYYDGIDLAVTMMIHLAKGEFTAYDRKPESSINPNVFLLIIPLLLLGFFYWLIWSGWSHGKSIGKKVPFLTSLKLHHSARSSHSGSWDGFTASTYGGGGYVTGGAGSGYTGGGAGGGGFGGFGGGSFGGGGAGGSW